MDGQDNPLGVGQVDLRMYYLKSVRGSVRVALAGYAVIFSVYGLLGAFSFCTGLALVCLTGLLISEIRTRRALARLAAARVAARLRG